MKRKKKNAWNKKKISGSAVLIIKQDYRSAMLNQLAV